MKDFMMIFLGASYDGLSPEVVQGKMGQWFGWQEKMAKEGREPRGNALTPVGRGISGKDKVVTDGPLVEGKEMIGGYYVFKAKDMDDAQSVVEDGYPDFELGGSVEIREVQIFE